MPFLCGAGSPGETEELAIITQAMPQGMLLSGPTQTGSTSAAAGPAEVLSRQQMASGGWMCA